MTQIAPETEPKTVTFTHHNAQNFADTSDLLDKQWYLYFRLLYGFIHDLYSHIMAWSNLFIYLFVHKSRAPVTWFSAVAILVVSVVSSNFFLLLFQVIVSRDNSPRSQKATQPDPACAISAACARAFTLSKDNI